MITVKLIYYHKGIDVAERYKAKRKNAQSMHTFHNKRLVICPKK